MCEFCESIVEMQYANQTSIVKDGNRYHIFDDGGGDFCVQENEYFVNMYYWITNGYQIS